MRKAMLTVTGLLLIAALASPAFAFYRVISDKYDRNTGTGEAIVELTRDKYVLFLYRDMDRSQSFTARDQVISMTPLRPGNGDAELTKAIVPKEVTQR